MRRAIVEKLMAMAEATVKTQLSDHLTTQKLLKAATGDGDAGKLLSDIAQDIARNFAGGLIDLCPLCLEPVDAAVVGDDKAEDRLIEAARDANEWASTPRGIEDTLKGAATVYITGHVCKRLP